MTYFFSVDWFTNNIEHWDKYLKKYKGEKVRALEIGSYEGRSTIWLLENILTHKDAKIDCIDNFIKKNTFDTFIKNMEAFKKKYTLYKKDSSLALKDPKVLKQEYDIIYIDADHHSRHVLEDLVLSWPLLKAGGTLIIDDNTDSKEHDNRCPKPAINSFLNAYANELKVIYSKWQVIVTKRKTPLKTTPCISEFYDP